MELPIFILGKMIRLFLLLLLFSSAVFGQEKTVGVISFDARIAYEGYTLYSPLQGTDSYLLNNCGQVINKWPSTYTPGVAAYLDSGANLWRSGVNREDNDFQHPGTGGYLQNIAWNGDIIWEGKVAGAHHDFEVMPNGNLLIVAWEILDSTFLRMNGYGGDLSTDFWAEAIYEIEPSGTEDYSVVWEWHTMDHLVQSIDASALNYTLERSPRRIDINFRTDDDSDWQHINAIDYNSEKDQIIVSLRNFNELWILDHSTTSAEAKTSEGGRYGHGGDLLFRWGNDKTFLTDGETYLDGQHDTRFFDESITIFNNGLESGQSRPMIIIPTLNQDGDYLLEESFSAIIDSSFYWMREDLEIDSPILSSFEILPNGNALVCSGDQTRMYETDKERNVAWHYRGTVSLLGPIEQGSQIVGSTFNVTKYSVDDIRFENLDVSVKAQSIEVNPLNLGCELSNIDNELLDAYRDYYYADGYLWKTNFTATSGDEILNIYTISGRHVLLTEFSSDRILLTQLDNGFYIYQIERNVKPTYGTFVKN